MHGIGSELLAKLSLTVTNTDLSPALYFFDSEFEFNATVASAAVTSPVHLYWSAPPAAPTILLTCKVTVSVVYAVFELGTRVQLAVIGAELYVTLVNCIQPTPVSICVSGPMAAT